MIRAWRSGQRPRTKFDAYHHGIDNLLLETNKAHQARGSSASTAFIPELRRAASAASSALLLSHATALSRVDVSPDEQDLIPLSVVPFEHVAVVEHVLGRRVFSSLASDQFQPVHRTIAEFLAAEDLARRIRDGLPISRVLALMCGPDGAPVSALRGLFAWWMCHLGANAERHVGLDPYAVATYSDGAHLPPAAQRAVWTSLASADDPWFFANENERGTFHGLANQNTKSVIRSILSDRDASAHLTVACLEAVAACPAHLGLDAEIKAHAFADDDNTWLRAAALRALLRQGDDTTAASLEQQLAARTADTSAASLRIALLREIARPTDFAARVISILQQYKSSRGARHVVGSLYPLREMIKPEDRDALLDASESLLPEHRSSSVELEHLFKDELIDRLSHTAAPINPTRLLSWLARIKSHQSNGDVDAALGVRLRHEPLLFDGLFDAAVRKSAPTTSPDIIRALRVELGRWVPNRVWPSPPHAYLLDRASGETNAALAAGYFMESIHLIPSVGFTLSDADTAMALLDARPDIAAAASGWDRYAVDDYQIAERIRVISVREETERNRAAKVAELAPDLAAISAGTHLRALTWAVRHFGRKDGDNTAPFDTRLVKRTDETTACAIIDGMAHFITTSNLPSVDEMLRCGRENSFTSHAILLMISAWMRLRDNQPIPTDAEAAVIAGAIVNTEIFVRVPDANAVFADWFAGRLTNPQSPARAMLSDAWRDAVDRGETSLPRFHDLARREDCAGVLSNMAPAVFGVSCPPTPDVALAVIRHLLAHDGEALLRLAPKPTNPPANDGLAGIWLAATFAADLAATGLREQFAMLSATDAWSAIDVWRGDDLLFGPMSPLTADKTAEMIVAVGARFRNSGHHSVPAMAITMTMTPLASSPVTSSPWQPMMHPRLGDCLRSWPKTRLFRATVT